MFLTTPSSIPGLKYFQTHEVRAVAVESVWLDLVIEMESEGSMVEADEDIEADSLVAWVTGYRDAWGWYVGLAYHRVL